MKTNSRMSTGCCLWTSENLTGICGTVVSFFKEYTLQLNEHSHWIKLLICSWTFHHSYSAVFLSRFYHCVTYYSILFTTCPSNYTVPSTTSEVILFSRIYSKPLLAHQMLDKYLLSECTKSHHLPSFLRQVFLLPLHKEKMEASRNCFICLFLEIELKCGLFYQDFKVKPKQCEHPVQQSGPTRYHLQYPHSISECLASSPSPDANPSFLLVCIMRHSM